MPDPQRPATARLEMDGGVATLWLDRPARLNAIDAALVEDLLASLDTLTAQEDTVGAVILAGTGRAFCAGADVTEPRQQADSRPRLERLQEVTRRLRALRQPVVAAVQGYAIGAGAEFTLACDLALAAEDATIAFPEVGLGLSITGGASRLLPLIVGARQAKELVLLGDRIDAPTAERLGLFNTLTTPDGLMSAARELAGRIAAKPAPATALAKRALDAGMDSALDPSLELEISHALITDSDEQAAPSAAHHPGRSREPQ